MTRPTLTNVQPGDYVTAMVMTGTSYDSEEYSPIQGKVIRVNRKTISVVWDHSGRFQRVDPHNLEEVKSAPFWETVTKLPSNPIDST